MITAFLSLLGLFLTIPDGDNRPVIELAAEEIVIIQATAEKGAKIDCLTASDIVGYKVIDNRTVRFDLKDGRTALARVKRDCGDLEYHHYISYVPMNGKLCAKKDEIVTREGIHCGIKSIQILKAKASK